MEEAALELDSWEWNGQRRTGHRAQERKEKEGWRCTTIHREKPGLDRGREGEDQSRPHRGSEIPGWEVGLDSVGNQVAH